MIRFALMAILAFSAVAQAQAPGRDDSRHIVTFRQGTPQGERANAVQRAGGKLRFNYSTVDAVAITAATPSVLAGLGLEPSVLNIVPDREFHAIQGATNGLRVDRKGSTSGTTITGQVIPQGVKRVGVPTSTSNGMGVGVAIVDTGIDLANADLAPSSLRFNIYGTSCQDDNGHGTHVSGIVAALDNAIDVVGVAPAATLYCVKVLDSTGSGFDSDIIAGLEFVLANAATAKPPIRVVNLSLGRDGSVNDNPTLRTTVKNLYNAGITVVVAAGNNASKEVKDMVPASFPEVLAVAATTAADGTSSCRRYSGVIKADTASYFTTDGAYQVLDSTVGRQGVTISEPGEDQENISKGCFISSVGILSSRLGGGTVRLSGTSMASPHVAGIVARMIQNNILGPENIRFTLRTTAQGLLNAPLDSPTSSYSFDGEREGIAKAP